MMTDSCFALKSWQWGKKIIWMKLLSSWETMRNSTPNLRKKYLPFSLGSFFFSLSLLRQWGVTTTTIKKNSFCWDQSDKKWKLRKKVESFIGLAHKWSKQTHPSVPKSVFSMIASDQLQLPNALSAKGFIFTSGQEYTMRLKNLWVALFWFFIANFSTC